MHGILWRWDLSQHIPFLPSPLNQNFYYEHPAVTARSESEVQRYRESRDIHVTGEGVPKPVTTFDEASFPGGCCPRV